MRGYVSRRGSDLSFGIIGSGPIGIWYLFCYAIYYLVVGIAIVVVGPFVLCLEIYRRYHPVTERDPKPRVR
jgi:hypothetical protein